MKKITIIILIFLFSKATVSNAAGFFSDERSDGYYSTGSIYNGQRISYRESESSNNYSGGFFRDSNEEEDIENGRPGTGGGVGQDAPIGNGLYVLLSCCAAFALVKTVGMKRRK